MFKRPCLIILFLAALALFIIAGPLPLSKKQDLNTIEPVEKDERILILAPHPDDEAIGTAGIIQSALQAGAPIKVCYLTNGDFNELSYLLTRVDIAFFSADFLRLGRQRRQEAIRAMNYLGLHDSDLLFLGYPDFGTLEIMLKYWGKDHPFEHPLTRISRVPYKDAPYEGESILKDLKKVLLDFKPTKIFVSHPADTNQDHRALYLFLRVALWDLADKIKEPQVLPYIVHVVGWPRPKGYYPNQELIPPQNLKRVPWRILALKPQETQIKHKAISLYPSQVRCDPAYLYSFARKNELFGDYPPLKLTRAANGKVTWRYLGEGGNINGESKISNLAYAVRGSDLFIRFNLRKGVKKHIDLIVFLLGYSKEREFSQMPKIRLDINKANLLLRDKEKFIFAAGAYFRHGEEAGLIKVPLSELGDPDYILSSAMAKMRDLSADEISWRILEVER
ncbi:MAG: PIG-L family deacetylase [Candidatus Omnitrophota bacterium]|nr:PIG-L family deacetylase [Candidatus Omnitrophota bacterium]